MSFHYCNKYTVALESNNAYLLQRSFFFNSITFTYLFLPLISGCILNIFLTGRPTSLLRVSLDSKDVDNYETYFGLTAGRL